MTTPGFLFMRTSSMRRTYSRRTGPRPGVGVVEEARPVEIYWCALEAGVTPGQAFPKRPMLPDVVHTCDEARGVNATAEIVVTVSSSTPNACGRF
jgi:hypothetical protein